MSKPNSSLGRSRDFGTTGSGKGSSDRTTNLTNFINNLAEVKFDGVTGLRKVGLKLVKTYGAPPQERFVENEAEWNAEHGVTNK